MIHLLHGAVGEPADWDGFIPLLGDRSVRAVDLYGGEVLPFDEMAEELNAGSGAGDVLIGYSMGGRLGLHALVAATSRWSRAVIISADPGPADDPEERRARDASWAQLAREDWGTFCVRWEQQEVFGGTPSPWRRGGFSPRRREAVAQGFEQWSLGLQRDLREEIGACAIPLLWVVGERDRKFVRLAEEICAATANAQLLVVGDAGHRVPWDQAEAVAGAIQSFLS